MTSTMKAVRIHEYGEPSTLRYEDAPYPTPGPEEVLVKVYAAGLNPVDWKTRAGRGMAGRYPNPFPLILGWDISGVVEAVGPQAAQFKPGDEVFGMVRFPAVGSAYAEYVAAPQTHLALKPRHVDHLQAAAIPLVALTAWQGLIEHAEINAGQRILITAAAGGVGHLAVQIAKWQGAAVIGTASPDKLDYVRSLGVDQVIDYTAVRFEEAVDPVDVVFDTVGGETLARSLHAVKSGGRLVTIAGSPDAQAADQRHVKTASFLVRPEPSHLNQIADLIASGHLKTTVSHVFPLQETQKAHARGEQGHLLGKIVLQVHP